MLPEEKEFERKSYQRKEKHSTFRIVAEEQEILDINPVFEPLEISQGLSYHERKSKLILQSRYSQERLSACMRNINEDAKKLGYKTCSLIPNGNWAHLPFDWLSMMTSLLNVINRAIQENDISIINELQESQKYLYSQLVSILPMKDDNELPKSLQNDLKHPEHSVNKITSLTSFKGPTNNFKSTHTMTSLLSSDECKVEEWYIPQPSGIAPYLNDDKVQPFHELIEFMMSLPRNTKNFRTYKDLKMASTNDELSESLSVKTLIMSEKSSLKNESYRGLLRNRLDNRSISEGENTIVLSDSFDDSDYSEFDVKYIKTLSKDNESELSDNTMEYSEGVILERGNIKKSTKNFVGKRKELNDRTISFTEIFSQKMKPFDLKIPKIILKSIYVDEKMNKDVKTQRDSGKNTKVKIKIHDKESTHYVHDTFVDNIKLQRVARKMALLSSKSEKEKPMENKEARHNVIKKEVMGEIKSSSDIKFKKRDSPLFKVDKITEKTIQTIIGKTEKVKLNEDDDIHKKFEKTIELRRDTHDPKEAIEMMKSVKYMIKREPDKRKTDLMKFIIEERNKGEKTYNTISVHDTRELNNTVSKEYKGVTQSMKDKTEGEINQAINLLASGEEHEQGTYLMLTEEGRVTIQLANKVLVEEIDKYVYASSSQGNQKIMKLVKAISKRDVVNERKIVQNPLNRKPWTTQRNCSDLIRIDFYHFMREKEFVGQGDEFETSFRNKILKKRYKIYRKKLKISAERKDSFQNFLKIIPECRKRKQKIYHLIYPKIVRPTINSRLPEIVISNLDECAITGRLIKFHRLSKHSIKCRSFRIKDSTKDSYYQM